MSDDASIRPVQPKLQPMASDTPRFSRGTRWAVYGVLIVMGLLIAAYFDGGEKPIRPIVQEVPPSFGAGAGQ